MITVFLIMTGFVAPFSVVGPHFTVNSADIGNTPPPAIRNTLPPAIGNTPPPITQTSTAQQSSTHLYSTNQTSPAEPSSSNATFATPRAPTPSAIESTTESGVPSAELTTVGETTTQTSVYQSAENQTTLAPSSYQGNETTTIKADDTEPTNHGLYALIIIPIVIIALIALIVHHRRKQN
jgi:cobalamin biosynthesis Mg chelatase CobN